MADRAEPFSAEALHENRAGHLSNDQVLRFERMVAGRRQRTRGLAVPVAAIGALLLIMSGAPATAVTRLRAGWGFVVAAAMIMVAPAFDPLAADLRDGRVEAVEGAVGKRRVQSMTRTGGSRYYLTVGGRQLRTFLSAYEAAPDAGYVRAYYVPRTRRLVNLERLPNPHLPANADEARDMLGRMARAFFSRDRVASAEARAEAAGLIDAARESIVDPSDKPLGGGHLTHEALVGRWTHPLLTLTLAAEGTAKVTTTLGLTKTGHWSVDGQGRLLTDATGAMGPTDAVLEADRLTIQFDGQRLTFTRGAEA